MTTRKTKKDHELPTLTDLEAENIIVRKKEKDRKKPIFTEPEGEDNDRQRKGKC